MLVQFQLVNFVFLPSLNIQYWNLLSLFILNCQLITLRLSFLCVWWWWGLQYCSKPSMLDAACHAIFRILKMATHLNVISIFYCLSVDSFVQFYQEINAINYFRYFLGNEMFCEQNLLLFKRASYSGQYHLIFPCSVFTIKLLRGPRVFQKEKM